MSEDYCVSRAFESPQTRRKELEKWVEKVLKKLHEVHGTLLVARWCGASHFATHQTADSLSWPGGGRGKELYDHVHKSGRCFGLWALP